MEQSAGLSGLRWHRARDPAAGIWKGLLLVVIYKDQASLRMYRFPWPLNLIWLLQASSGLSPPASKENLTNNLETRDMGLAEGAD